MSKTSSLNQFYGSFFLKCGAFAVSPYLLILNAFMDANPKTEELVLGAAVCVVLSTVVPVLPAITSITFAIASFAASIGVVSMFLSYPIVLLADAFKLTCDLDKQAFAY